MTLKSHSLLSLVGSGVYGLTGFLLGIVFHLLSFLGSSVGSILSCILDGIASSTYG